MRVLTRSEIQKLANTKQIPSISIMMPTGTTDFGELRSRFRDILVEAREQLSVQFEDQSLKHKALYSGYELLHDRKWWEQADKSAAVYIAEDFIRAYHLADEHQASVSVGKGFDIVPLLESISDGEFHILALSQRKVKLLWTNRHAIEEVKLSDMPAPLIDSIRANISGDKAKQEKPDIFKYLRQVDNVVTPYLRSTNKPLVLVGLPHVVALYQGITSYNQVVKKYVAKNPDGMTMLTLRDRAWTALKPLARRDQRLAYSQLDRLSRSQPHRTARGFRQVMDAIAEGKVQTLFINTNIKKWGSLNATRAVDVHDEPLPGDVNLLNMMAHSAIRGGQHVFSLPESSNDVETAAILRS